MLADCVEGPTLSDVMGLEEQYHEQHADAPRRRHVVQPFKGGESAPKQPGM